MSTESEVMALLEEGNPATEVPETAWSETNAAAYLATLEQRSSEVTQLDTRPQRTRTEPTSQKQPPMRWLVAAAVIILAGVAFLLTNLGSDEPPVVTDPPPTTVPEVTSTTIPEQTSTTAAVPEPVDPRIEEGLALAIAYAEADAVLDFETKADLGIETRSPESYEVDLEFREAIGWTDAISDCAVSSSNPIGMTVICTVTQTTAFSQALGVAPAVTDRTYTVRYEGEVEFLGGPTLDKTRVLTVAASDRDMARWANEAWEPFVAWIQENHPEDVDVMFTELIGSGIWQGGRGVPAPTAESNALWRQYTAEFVAAQGG